MVRAVPVASGAEARAAGRAPDTARAWNLNLLSRGRGSLGGCEAFGLGRGVDHECGRIGPSQNSRRVAGDRCRGRRDLVAPGRRADRPALGRRRLLHPGHLAGERRGVSAAERARKYREQPASAVSPGARGDVPDRHADLGSGAGRPCLAADGGAGLGGVCHCDLRSAQRPYPAPYALAAALIAFCSLNTRTFPTRCLPRPSSACSRSCSSSSSDTGRIRLVFSCRGYARFSRTRRGPRESPCWRPGWRKACFCATTSARRSHSSSRSCRSSSWIGWIKAVESSPEYQQPAYAYQRAPYVYFNVSYARNLTALADPSTPELGPLTATLASRPGRSNVKALPASIGQTVSGWEAPARVALPLALLVVLGMVLQARRKQYLMLMYVALSLAAVCVTPFQKQFVRYLMPLYPFFALALFQTACEARPGAGIPVQARSGFRAGDCGLDRRRRHGVSGARGSPQALRAPPSRRRLRAAWTTCVEYKLFYYAPLGTSLRPGAGLAAVACGPHRCHRCDRPAVGASSGPEGRRCCRPSSEWQDGAAADRHRAGEIPDRRKQARAARLGRVPPIHFGPPAREPRRVASCLEQPARAASRSTSERVDRDSRPTNPPVHSNGNHSEEPGTEFP